MLILIPILFVILAGCGIFALRPIAEKITIIFHSSPVINRLIKFQFLQLILAIFFLCIVYFLNPGNFSTYFQAGNVDHKISRINWLGVTGNETWLEVALSIGIFISIGTAVFMFFQFKKAGVDYRYFPFSFLWAVPFSITNAFSEEAIFRLGIVSPLSGLLSVSVIVLISAVLFGVPHYFGMPSGVIGVIMAGFLGWLLALSLVETQGLMIAWAIHFVQDVIIITSMILMSKKRSTAIISL
ncbi:MAG: CPBP family intramembrane glutamic endopeptidase [Chloroflexota bacterium]